MTRFPFQPRWGIVPASALLVALLLVPGYALASPAAPLGSGPAHWAYAGEDSVSHLVTVSGTLGGSYRLNASFATTAIFTQRNTSTRNFTVEMNRTVSFVLFAELCPQSCPPGGAFVNLTLRASEVDELTASLTRDGSVTLENGSTLPAFALLSSESLLVQNLTEGLSWRTSATGSGSGSGYVYRSAQSRLQVSVDLGPAGLGLIPTEPRTDQPWNASAPGTISVNYQVACTVVAVNGASPCGPGAGQLVGSAQFAVSGTDEGTTDQRDDGVPTQGMNLSLTSPGRFVLEDGVLLVPTVADLFQAPTPSSSPPPFQQVTTTQLNWLGQASHLGVVASTTLFAPHLPGTAKGDAAGSILLAAAQPAQSPLGNYTLYGAPVPPAEAYNQSCQELAGCNGPPGSRGPIGGGGLGFPGSGLLLEGTLGVVAVVAILIAAVMVLRPRSRAPAPQTGAGDTLPPPPPAAPGEEDPLGRLW